MSGAPTIEPERWVAFMRDEYVNTFVRDGGSSIKFAVAPDEPSRSAAVSGVRRCAEEAGYVTASASAAETRVHLMDQLFFRIAEQVPWRALSQEALNALAMEANYHPAPAGPGEYIERLCEANGLGAAVLQQALRPRMERRIFKNAKLARDFRLAVTQLCHAELSGGDDREMRFEAITNWLTGRNRAIAAVKPYGIFTRIQRTNARHLVASLLTWVRFAGHAGMYIDVDLSRVTLPSNPGDGSVFYTKAAMFDAYEVMRQFIDATDEMEGLVVVVTSAPGFLDESPMGRGLGAYGALMARVFDGVYGAGLVNPMASLVRVTKAGGAA